MTRIPNSIAIASLALSTLFCGGAYLYKSKQYNDCRKEVKIMTAKVVFLPPIAPVIPAVPVLAAILPDSLTSAITSAGNSHVVAQSHIIGNSITQPFLDAIAVRDSLLSVQRRKIAELSIENPRLKTVLDSNRLLVKMIENTRRLQPIIYKDRSITLSLRPTMESDTVIGFVVDSNVTVNSELVITDSTSQYKPYGVPLGTINYFTKIRPADERVQLDGNQSIVIKRRIPLVGVRGQILTSWNPEDGGWRFGPGTRVDVGDRWNMGVNYLYDIVRNRWVTSVYAKWDWLIINR